MSESKHTPGPWNLTYGHQQSESGLKYWQIDDGSDAIACNQFCYAGNLEANARLIAAAPDLLEAGQSQTAILRRAQSILSRYLQGQPSGLGRDQAIDALLGLLDGPDQRGAQDAWEAAIAKAEGRS